MLRLIDLLYASIFILKAGMVPVNIPLYPMGGIWTCTFEESEEL